MSTIIDRSSPIGRAAFLLRDEFTDARAAGAIDGTPTDPGPGVRAVVDTASKLSITGGQLSFAVGSAANDPQLRLTPPVSRQAGRLVMAALTMSVMGAEIGWDSNTAGSPSDAIRATGTILTVRNNIGAPLTIGTPATATTYQIAVAVRATGAAYAIKGGAFTTWSLLWMGNAGTYSPLWPTASATGATGVFVVDRLRVPAGLWLPAPVASDGFGGAFGTTDGQGHAEGVTGGLGSGGASLAWTQALGTWQTAGGVASAATLSTGVAIAVVDTGKADVIATLRYTHSAGTGSVLVRYTSATNWVRATHTGTNAQLVKNVDGVQTTLIDAAAAYVAGAELRISAVGSAFRLYYDDALIGAEQTIADAGLQSGTRQGIRSTDTGNTFDDFVVYARGSGDEYAALDRL